MINKVYSKLLEDIYLQIKQIKFNKAFVYKNLLILSKKNLEFVTVLNSDFVKILKGKLGAKTKLRYKIEDLSNSFIVSLQSLNDALQLLEDYENARITIKNKMLIIEVDVYQIKIKLF